MVWNEIIQSPYEQEFNSTYGLEDTMPNEIIGSSRLIRSGVVIAEHCSVLISSGQYI